MIDEIKQLKKIDDVIHSHNELLNKKAKEFLLGKTITFVKGNGTIKAKVLSINGMGDYHTVTIINLKTKKEYYVFLWDIMEGFVC